MIKFAFRPNLKYPLQLIIWSFIRDIERDIIGKYFSNINLIYLPLMFLGEFLFGLTFYLYQQKYLKNNRNKNKVNFFGIELIDNKEISLKRRDKKYVEILLIIFSAFFDAVEFVLSTEILPNFINISPSIELRLNGLLIILQAIFYRHVLKFTVFKHQYFSLIIIAICLTILIITEYLFHDFNIFLNFGAFTMLFVVLFFIQFFNSLLDLVDKYLFEFDHVNPFKCLMLEGIFGVLYSIIYFIYKNPTKDIYKYYKDDADNNVLLIILLILYLILCGGQNSFRVITNKIYSPMAATLSQYFLNPIYIIFTLLFSNDFISYGKRNYFYFIINLLLAIIISLSGCVYNEFFILFFCGLQHETHYQITCRAITEDKIFSVNDDFDEDETII